MVLRDSDLTHLLGRPAGQRATRTLIYLKINSLKVTLRQWLNSCTPLGSEFLAFVL